MVEVACPCGAVHLQIAQPPQTVTDCNCSLCRKLGVLWAYYATADVTIAGATDIYQRGERELEIHRCKICGCTTHWLSVANSARRDAFLGLVHAMGVNARLMPPEILATTRIRKLDGAATWKYLDE